MAFASCFEYLVHFNLLAIDFSAYKFGDLDPQGLLIPREASSRARSLGLPDVDQSKIDNIAQDSNKGIPLSRCEGLKCNAGN